MKKYVVSVNFGSYEDFESQPLVVVDTRDEAHEQIAKLEKFFEEVIPIVRNYKLKDYNLFTTFKDFLKNTNS